MEKPYEDFRYLSGLVKEFLAKKSLRAAFRVIGERSITGWEVWFQVEFARFLADHPDQPEWYRELRFEFDYRRERSRSYLKPDFVIRKKHAALDRYMALEIKQHAQAGNCVANMVADLSKVGRIRQSQIDLRSYWALGIFRADEDDDPFATIEAKLAEYDLPFYQGLTAVDSIGATGFAYALLPGIDF